jgi:hypothetical protein
MPPRKRIATAPAATEGAKIGEPAPKAIIDTDTASVGIPPQPDYDPREELRAMRKQLETLRHEISAVARSVKGGAMQAARQTEATAKLYPVSSLLAVAAVAGACAFAIAGFRASTPRSRYDRALDEMRDLYDRVRDRL